MRLKLREWLSIRNMTQKELAKRMGVTQVTVNNWVQGKTKPNIEQLSKLAKTLDCDVKELI